MEDIQDGKVLEIENEGMPIRGETDAYGKLLATININYKKFGADELALIKRIFEKGRENNEDLWSSSIIVLICWNKIIKIYGWMFGKIVKINS